MSHNGHELLRDSRILGVASYGGVSTIWGECVDLFGLALHLIGGIIGGRFAGCTQSRADNDRAGGVIAAAIGGLLGGQIIERSMALRSAPLSDGALDAGAAIAGLGGAGAGGAVLATLIALLCRRLRRQ